MAFQFVRSRLAALLLGSAMLVPVAAQTVLALPAAKAPGADLRQALTIPPGGVLRLESLPLGDLNAELATADLRRTNAGSTPPLVVVHSGDEVTQTRAAPRAHFTGQLVDDPKSSVFVSIDSDGAMRSIVRRGEDVFVSDMPAASAPGTAGTAGLKAPALNSRQVALTTDGPTKPFVCETDSEFIEKNYVPPSAALLANLRNNNARAALLGAAPGPQRRADLIIETDYALFQLLGSRAAVEAYVTDLLGYASSQYESEIGARLNLTQINVYTTPTQPWTSTTSSGLLDQLQAYWNSASRSSQARHHVHLLSGRDTRGGVAYINTLASNKRHIAYGVSGSITGKFSASNPQVIWDSIVVAHEIGHAFGSDHTHSFDAPYVGSNEGGAIDCCYSDDSSGQCGMRNGGAGRTGVLPGVNSREGGIANTGAGTIMSYCHFPVGYMSNMSFNFGTNHTRGVNAWRVASVMQSSAQTNLPQDNSVRSYTLSVSRQGTGTGTVSSLPAGINCGTSCSADFVAGAPITLTATPAVGSSFTGWTGACVGATIGCTISINAVSSVVANFTATPTTRLISLSKSGQGTGSVTSNPAGLSCAAGCPSASASFASSTAVTLTAQASTGSTFAGWSGACSGTSSCTIAANSTSASVTANFGTNTEGGGPLVDPSVFVSQQYQDFLRRSPDNASLNYWVTQLNAGSASRGQVIDSLMSSAEFQGRFGPVVRLYTAYFKRLPDYPGLMYWFNAMYPLAGPGSNLAQVSEIFSQSKEFVNTYGTLNNEGFITLAYRNVLGRAPDAAGQAAWLDRMANGMSRGEVMIGFSESLENKSATANSVLVTMVYMGMLRREPDAAGYAYWLSEANAGRGGVLRLINSLLISKEYAARF